MKAGLVQSVHRSPTHTMAKYSEDQISLIEGLGVDGDAHAGKFVKHRSRIHLLPRKPNLRQVHFIHNELIDELQSKGFKVAPGIMGENITTSGLDILGLPEGTILHIGETAKVRVTGLRNPCKQLDGIQNGLMKAVLDKTPSGELIRKAGIMSVVIEGGDIRPGDPIIVHLPEGPFKPLDRV